MAKTNEEILTFIVEWYDPLPQLKRQYLLKYFQDHHQVEMFDIKNKKIFLKKSKCPEELSSNEFMVGNKILLYSRELEIVDFGDSRTKDKLQYQSQVCVMLLPYEMYQSWGKVIMELTNEGFHLFKIKSIICKGNDVEWMLSNVFTNTRNDNWYDMYADGVSLVVVMTAQDGYNKLNLLRQNKLNSMVGSFLRSSNSLQSTALTQYIFDQDNVMDSVTLDSCTCCIVKPHAIKAKQFGKILDMIISQGYEVSAIKSIYFDKVQCEEFLEVYKGVVPKYVDHTIQLSSGLSIALEIRAQNAVETFRETAGPWDVEMAKELRPDTIRGQFGYDRVYNVIHCTDLPEDGMAECEYCFRLLA